MPAFTTNGMTSDYLSSISPGWVVISLGSQRMVLTFLIRFDLLGDAPTIRISILKIFKLLPNYWHMVTATCNTIFKKHLESSSGHSLTFYLNLVKYRFKNMFLKESLTQSSTVIYSKKKLRRIKCEANFVWSDSETVKSLRRRKYDPAIIERTIGLVLDTSTALYKSFRKHCTLTNKAMGTIWRELSNLPQRRQGPDPRPLWLLF